MSERVHPDDPCFHDKVRFRLRRCLIPWIEVKRNPYRAAFFWRYRWVSEHCGGKDVLDVPCGMGWGTSQIRGFRSLSGVDLSDEAIREANHRYGTWAHFQCGDMAKLDFADSSFDVVSCLEGIEHVPVEIGRRFLKESERILRRDGLLLLSSPYCRTMEHSGNPYHVHEYQPEEIEAMLCELFTIENVITRDVDIMTVLYIRCRRRAA
jgi:2-polyprenyl-3-methyl-5-hydroxy-6-metoxy-1,4-benzoquinol methylase